jgi:hypothetical protein
VPLRSPAMGRIPCDWRCRAGQQADMARASSGSTERDPDFAASGLDRGRYGDGLLCPIQFNPIRIAGHGAHEILGRA